MSVTYIGLTTGGSDARGKTLADISGNNVLQARTHVGGSHRRKIADKHVGDRKNYGN
jgi:hypothetical protein